MLFILAIVTGKGGVQSKVAPLVKFHVKVKGVVFADQLSNIIIENGCGRISIHHAKKPTIGLPTIDNLNKDITISHFHVVVDTTIRCAVTLHLQTYDVRSKRQVVSVCICELRLIYNATAPILDVIGDVYNSVYDKISRSVIVDFGHLNSDEIDVASFYITHLFLYYLVKIKQIGGI